MKTCLCLVFMFVLFLESTEGKPLSRTKRWDIFTRFGEYLNNIQDRIGDSVDAVTDIADTVGVHTRQHMDLAMDQLEDLGVDRERLDQTKEKIDNVTREAIAHGRDIITNGRNTLRGMVDSGLEQLENILRNSQDFIQRRKGSLADVGDTLSALQNLKTRTVFNQRRPRLQQDDRVIAH